MRIVILTIVLPLVVIIGSCTRQNPNLKTKKSYKIDNLGQISIQDLESNMDSILSLPKSLDSVTVYNSTGQVAKVIHYYDGKVANITKYQYDDLGNRTERIRESDYLNIRRVYYYNIQNEKYRDEEYHYYKDEEEFLVWRFEYEFENGNIIAKHNFNYSSEGVHYWAIHYTYDIKNRMTSEKITSTTIGDGITTYKYNDEDNSVTEERYDYNNNLKWKYIRKYNENNEKIETTSFNENNEFEWKAFFNYNSNNDLIEIKSYDNNNELLKHIRYIRKYDNHGNEILNAYFVNNNIQTINIHEF